MSILVRITVDDKGNPVIEKLGKNAKKAETALTNMGVAAKKAEQSSNSLGNSLSKAFSNMAIYGGMYNLAFQLKNITQEAAQFSLAMKKIEVVGEVGSRQISNLSQSIRELSADSEYSASAIAKAGLEIIKMGEDADGAKNVLPEALNLATVAGEDLQWTATNLMNVMRAFGLETKDTGKYADIMRVALNESGLNLKDYMEAMTYVAPIAKSMGYSLEETSAFLAVFADRSMKGTHAGTLLKDTMLRLLKQSDDTKGSLEGLNLETASLSDIMSRLSKTDMSKMLDQFGMIALPGALTASDEKVLARVAEIKKMFSEASGEGLAAQAESIRSELIPQWQKLGNAIVDVGISLNNAMGSETKTLLQELRDQFLALSKYVEKNEGTIRRFADAITKALGFIVQNGDKLLAIWGALWLAKHVKTISGMAEGVLGLGKNAGNAYPILNKMHDVFALMGGPLSAALIGVGLLNQAVNKFVDDWNAKLDAIEERIGKKGYGSDEQIEDVSKIASAYTKLNRLKQEGAEYAKTRGPAYDPRGSIEQRMAIWDAAVALKLLKKEYADKWGEPNAKQLNSLEGAHTVFAMMTHNRDAIKKAKEAREAAEKIAAAEAEKKRPRGDPDPDEDKKGKKEKAEKPTELADAHVEQWKARAKRIAEMDFENDLNTRIMAVEEYDRDMQIKTEAELDAMARVRELKDEEKKKDEELAEARKELRQAELEDYMAVGSKFAEAGMNTYSIITEIQNRRSQEAIDRLDSEKQAIADRYKSEIDSAEDGSFKKAMLLARLAQEESAINKKIEKEKEEMRKRELWQKRIEATSNLISGVLGTMAQTYGGVYSRALAGAAYAALGTTYIAQMAALSYRSGKDAGEDVWGSGNGTSDSVWARVSKGEKILSERDVGRLGGNERIDSIIDRGGGSGSQLVVNIDTFVGTKEFARGMIPVIKRELVR